MAETKFLYDRLLKLGVNSEAEKTDRSALAWDSPGFSEDSERPILGRSRVC